MQPWENCNAEKLPYYTAVQAGIRWCGLTKYEDEILETMREKGDGVKFSQWPCLQPRIAELRYAMRIEEIPHGVDGNPKFDGQARSESRWTMTHADLRRWFKENASQTEWPAFLFDEIERKTHAAINADVFRTLQADRDAARAELERLKADAQGKDFQIAAMEKQIAALKVEIAKADTYSITKPPAGGRSPVPRDGKLIETIAALLAGWPGGAIPSGKDLEVAAQSIGLSISDDTIRKALKAAQEAAPSLPPPK